MAEEPYKANFFGNHVTSLLLDLNKDRTEKRSYCDVTLHVDKQEFKAHKCILGKLSTFFDKMFQADMKEKYESFANMQGLNFLVMKTVLDFIYTAEITITENNVMDLLAVSDYLQIDTIKGFCAEFLNQTINASNCVEIYTNGKRYNCALIVENAENVINNNLRKIMSTENFKAMARTQFVAYISSSSHKGPRSKMVYEAVLSWIYHDLENRKDCFVELFRAFKLHFLPQGFLQDVVANEALVLSSSACTDLVKQAIFWSSKLDTINIWEGTSQRKLFKFVLIYKTKVRIFNVFTHTWKELPDLSKDATGSAAVLHGTTLYVIGGNMHPTLIQCINIDTPNAWSTAGCIKMSRNSSLKATAWKNVIVVTAGNELFLQSSKQSGKYVSTVEVFEPTAPSYYTFSNMSSSHSKHYIVPHKDHLYCFDGGYGSCLDEVCINDTWSGVNKGRSCTLGSAVSMKNRIYVIDENFRVQCYHCDSKEWQKARPHSIDSPYVLFDSIVIGEEIYTFGRGKDSLMLLTYNPKGDVWLKLYEENVDLNFSVIKAI